MENENIANIGIDSFNFGPGEDSFQEIGRQNVSTIFEDIKRGFKKLKKGTKIAVTVTAAGVVLSIFLAVGHGIFNRYDILFSGLTSADAATITELLEEEGIKMKVEGDSIYVKSSEVDELRLTLSSNITNGSVGFEIMDESSGFGMTEEEFQIKKQRMIQGELERTIRTFPQVSDARVHITPGQESLFVKDNQAGSAAVYITLKTGQTLTSSQVMSVVSLVSASSTNIPKQNVEVIDQNMTLLSDGMFDDEGNYVDNATGSSSGLETARAAEKKFNEDLEDSILKVLTPLFGDGKVKVSVNTDLNFDATEKTELVFDPNSVIKSQTISENSTGEAAISGSPVDNNMSNTTEDTGDTSASRDSSTEYEVGKTETHTIVAPGTINKITASVVLDGVTSQDTIESVQELVETTIGLNTNRGDKVTVMSAKFDTTLSDTMKAEAEEAQKKEMIQKAITYGGGGVGAVALALILITALNKRKNKFFDDDEDYSAGMNTLAAEDIINKVVNNTPNQNANASSRETFFDANINTHPLEEEIRDFASKNPEQITELIKIWLNED
jgi:flagellar M-ring protein FliF